MAEPRPGETVVVVGLGPIGQLSARLFRRAGARVLATDVSEDRVQLARAADVEAVVAHIGVNATVRQRLPEGADVVVDATGSQAVLRDSVQLVRDRAWMDELPPSGRLVVQGSYSGAVLFPQDVAFTKELRMYWPRDCLRSDLQEVLRAMQQGELQTRDLLGESNPVETAPQVYQALRNREAGRLTAALSWKQ